MLTRIARKLIFPSHVVTPYRRPFQGVRDVTRIELPIADGWVEGFLLTAGEAKAPLVFYAHGNGELIEQWPEALQPYRDLGVSVFLPEYRGYGRSSGSPSEVGILSDFTRFYDALLLRDDIDADRIVLHGRSLGGGVVAQLATQRRCRALVLESTFTSIADVAKQWMVPGALIPDRFETERVLATLDVPTLVWHGRNDRLIPYRHAERLAAIAKRAELVLDEGTHNECPVDVAFYWRTMARFLREAGVTSAGE